MFLWSFIPRQEQAPLCPGPLRDMSQPKQLVPRIWRGCNYSQGFFNTGKVSAWRRILRDSISNDGCLRLWMNFRPDKLNRSSMVKSVGR